MVAVVAVRDGYAAVPCPLGIASDAAGRGVSLGDGCSPIAA